MEEPRANLARPAITFRPLTAADIGPAREFWKTMPGLGLSEADEPTSLVSFFKRNPGLSWGGFSGDLLVATVLVGHDARRGFLYHLAVDEVFRGQGAANELIRLGLEGLSRESITKVHVFVLADNPIGLSFWAGAARRGWRRRDDLLVFSRNNKMTTGV